ncbi:arylsulfatase [uncultured Paludibaculum sp.]|uniref:arylsulfatase n=1 Tax=uncultured Paludibaculum sp. TaxID=1765020 RepID=UPI002AAA6F47|nr:arylsulfatase [uncultured Paludibaculum sp.]
MITRRTALASAVAPAFLQAAPARPNVIFILTDDQGYGDLSLTGNPHLKTPSMDAVAQQGVQFTRFHVMPVCSPTRSCLMTGRYNYRTGVVDTYLGRSMMHSGEVTVAESLAGAGYQTGIFGKWHLGDNYPLRAIDQGFQTALTLRGGGLAQPASPPNTGYFDPPLELNGRTAVRKGYCSDIFFDEAMQFIEKNRRRPFFTYIAANAPHTPLQLKEEWAEPYRKAGLDDTTARIYGMIANLDSNLGRLMEQLRRLRLDQNTLLWFMTDNGPQQKRFNAGLRGLKTSPYEGGIRVPSFLRWPAKIQPGTKDNRIAAHIDFLPTVLDACGAPLPKDRKIDGRSLFAPPVERSLFFQWHRGDAPEMFRNCAVLTDRWKLVGTDKHQPELYDLPADPAEEHNLAAAEPGIARQLRSQYDTWFRDVSAERGYDPPRIFVGTPHENPVILSRQDWRGPQASWNADGLGHYEIDVRTAAEYEVTLRFPPIPQETRALLTCGALRQEVAVPAGATQAVLSKVVLPQGPANIEGSFEIAGRRVGAHYIELRAGK